MPEAVENRGLYVPETACMFLKRQHRRAGGEDYDYWSLVRTVRTARGPRHEVVARLGKLDGIEQEAARGWHHLDAALEDLLGISADKIHETRLCRGLDRLLDQKDGLCAHLQAQYLSWFGLGFEFLLYDVTSTYFERLAESNTPAARGYSRDHRADCKQVCIGLIVTPEGLPVGYEVFAGNRNDVTTLEEMVELMEQKYGQAKRVWVMDRGIASEENLSWLRQRGAHYLVGTPKKHLKKFEAALLEESDCTVS